jgi:hypothetical protein
MRMLVVKNHRCRRIEAGANLDGILFGWAAAISTSATSPSQIRRGGIIRKAAPVRAEAPRPQRET